MLVRQAHEADNSMAHGRLGYSLVSKTRKPSLPGVGGYSEPTLSTPTNAKSTRKVVQQFKKIQGSSFVQFFLVPSVNGAGRSDYRRTALVLPAPADWKASASTEVPGNSVAVNALTDSPFGKLKLSSTTPAEAGPAIGILFSVSNIWRRASTWRPKWTRTRPATGCARNFEIQTEGPSTTWCPSHTPMKSLPFSNWTLQL